MWSALVLGLLAAIFAWFWFGDSGDSEDPGEAAVTGAAELHTEPVESCVKVEGQRQQQAEVAQVGVEEAATEHLLNTEETTVCEAKTNYQNQTDQLDMGQREKCDLCYENQKAVGNFDTLSETSVAYSLDSELKVFPPAEGASVSHEFVLNSLTVGATRCDAQQPLLDVIPTVEGAQFNVQATVLDDQDVMHTFSSSEATKSSAQEAIQEVNAVQYTMPEAVIGAFTASEKSILHMDVSDVSPTAIAAAPLLLHESAMDVCTRTDVSQYIVQKDELAVDVEQFSGLKYELAAEAAHSILPENVLATKVTHTVLQRERLDAEAEHSVMLENVLTTKEPENHAHEYKLLTEAPHAILQEDAHDAQAGHVVHSELDAEVSYTIVQEDRLEVKITYTTVQEDGLDAEAPHIVYKVGLKADDTCTTIQEDGLDAETKLTTAQEDMQNSETPYDTTPDDGLDAEVPHTTLHKCELDASEAHITLEESGLDFDTTHVGVQEDGLDAEAEAAQAIIEEACPDFSPADKDIQNICISSKEHELLVHTISQKLGYINGHEVINHFAGCLETNADEELPTDSYATKELEILCSSLHGSGENSNQLYKSEPQTKNNDSDSKMRKIAAVTPMPQYVIVKFRVHYITHSESQLIAVTGNHESLGEWNIYVPLKPDKDGFWSDFVLLPVDSSIEWKFVMVENGKIKRWEECSNRYLKTGHDDAEAHQWWGYQ